MEELTFNSFEDAMSHLANISGRQVLVAASKPVKNPRVNPRNKAEEQNWDKSDMWGDPKNHKYPLFDNNSGELSAKRAKTALRYLNQERSKDSYPNNAARAKVLARIVRAILKADPQANIEYQPKDKTYQELPESVKKKMKGYKMASMEEEVRMAMRIAGSEEVGETTKSLKEIKNNLRNVNLDKKFSTLGLSGNELISMTPRQLIDLISQKVSDDVPVEVTEEEVAVATRCAADSNEVKDDLFQLIKKSSSQKYDKTIKQILGTLNINKVTVAELVDRLRDAIAKADEDEAEESVEVEVEA